MENTEKPASTETAITQPSYNWWIRLIGYAKRKIDERAAKKQKETPTDRTARVTATATLWIAIFTFVSVAVSVGTFVILKSQLKEMHDGGVDTHTLAEQTVNQVTMLRQQVVGTFAAAIPQESPFPQTISSDLELLNYTGIGLSFRNIGKVKATNFIADATMTRQSLPSYKPIGASQHRHIPETQIRPWEQTGQTQGSLADSASLKFDTNMLTETDVGRLHDLSETIEIKGYFQYDNGFGDIVHAPLCFLYTVKPQHIFEKSGAGNGGGGPGEWYVCEGAKDIIAQALKWKQKK